MNYWEGQTKEQMIRQAYEVGPWTVLFIQRLWDQAKRDVYGESLQIFHYARWYSAQRVEQAINRALCCGAQGIGGLRYILENELDLLSMCPETELTGQRVFPFMKDGERNGGWT